MDHSAAKSVMCALSHWSGVPLQPPSLCGTVCRVYMEQHMPSCWGLFAAPSDQLLHMVSQKLRVAHGMTHL